MADRADQIANEFISRYETAWNQHGAEAVSKLYTPDSVLVGYVVAIGKPEILKLLRRIIGEGWTGIKLKTVNARKVGDVILVANEYTVIGSGEKAGKTLDTKSSHVLVRRGGEWLSTLHTAR